jgi:hypothetical protein
VKSSGGITAILLRVGFLSGYAVMGMALWTIPLFGQGSTGPSSPIERAIDLATKHRCDEATPLLNELTPGATDKQLKYQALMAATRCAIRKKDGRATVTTLLALRHDYPNDPEVLYLTTQVFLQIAVHASQYLA